MGVIAALRRRSRLERRLLAEATALLPRAALAIRVSPLPRTMSFGAIPLGDPRHVPVDTLVWAVQAAARRMPFRAACFEQGLVVQRMLRRRGTDARLHYGIAPGARLEAHVWVSVDGVVVQGGEQAPRFSEVGTWP